MDSQTLPTHSVLFLSLLIQTIFAMGRCCSLSTRSTRRNPWPIAPITTALPYTYSTPYPMLKWAISRAFLCGVCMFSPCSQGVSSANNPHRKTCKKDRSLLSAAHRDGRFTWSPGAEKLPTAPGGSWRRDDQGWVKGREKIHGDLRPACACVCVCSVSCVE